MAIQTVLVSDNPDVASWERARPLDEELLDLERRLDRESSGEPLAALRAAIARRLCKRAVSLEQELRSAGADSAGDLALQGASASVAPPPGEAAVAPHRPNGGSAAASPEDGSSWVPSRENGSSGAPDHSGEDCARHESPPELAMNPQALRQRLTRLRGVPTLPKLSERVIAALEDPEVNLDSVAQLIEIDQALTSQMLRLANSAFYSAQGTVSLVTQALVMLGVVVSRSVVLCTGILDMRSIGLHGFWEHSLGCAVAAGAIAKAIGLKNPEEVTAAGLLHDLGKVALYKELPDVFEHIVAGARAGDRTFRDAEQSLLGMDHCDMIASLVEKWHFPACLTEPIIFHHRPSRASIARHETAIVHVADIIVRALGYGCGGDARIGSIEPAAWSRLELTPARLDRVLDLFDSDLDHALNYALYE
jgi:HD-like signal output (HDOD) protein